MCQSWVANQRWTNRESSTPDSRPPPPPPAACACTGLSTHGGRLTIVFLVLYGGVPCAVPALCEKLAVLHHREFGKFRILKGRH